MSNWRSNLWFSTTNILTNLFILLKLEKKRELFWGDASGESGGEKGKNHASHVMKSNELCYGMVWCVI